MNQVNIKALVGFLQLLVVLMLLIFVPAGTLCLLAGLDIPRCIFRVRAGDHLLSYEKRSQTPGAAGQGGTRRRTQEKSQRIIQGLAMVAFIAIVVFPPSTIVSDGPPVGPYATALGDVLVVLGFFLVFLVFKENTFASATIEVGSEQKVIATGPYALVRHPMYIGALVMLSGVPLRSALVGIARARSDDAGAGMAAARRRKIPCHQPGGLLRLPKQGEVPLAATYLVTPASLRFMP